MSAKAWAPTQSGTPLGCTACDNSPGECSLASLVGSKRDKFEEVLERVTIAENERSLCNAHVQFGFEDGKKEPSVGGGQGDSRSLATSPSGEASDTSFRPASDEAVAHSTPKSHGGLRRSVSLPTRRSTSPVQDAATRVIRRVKNMASRSLVPPTPAVAGASDAAPPAYPLTPPRTLLPLVDFSDSSTGFQSVRKDLDRIFQQHGDNPPASASANRRPTPIPFADRATSTARRIPIPYIRSSSARPTTDVEFHRAFPPRPVWDQPSRRQSEYVEELMERYGPVRSPSATVAPLPSTPEPRSGRRQLRKVASAYQVRGQHPSPPRPASWTQDDPFVKHRRDVSLTVESISSIGPTLRRKPSAWLATKFSNIKRSFSGLRRRASGTVAPPAPEPESPVVEEPSEQSLVVEVEPEWAFAGGPDASIGHPETSIMTTATAGTELPSRILTAFENNAAVVNELNLMSAAAQQRAATTPATDTEFSGTAITAPAEGSAVAEASASETSTPEATVVVEGHSTPPTPTTTPVRPVTVGALWTPVPAQRSATTPDAALPRRERGVIERQGRRDAFDEARL